MRATQARAARASRTRTLSLTMAIAAAVLGSVSAAALAAPSGHRTSRGQAAGSTSTAAIASAAGPRMEGHLRFAEARPRLVVAHRPLASPAGGTVVVHGSLEPSRRGALVRLETLRSHHWRTLAVGHTRRGGRFGIRYRVRGLGATWVRVRFGGNRREHAVSAAAGKIVALAPMVASWYDDAGNTACGFHATYGVANKTLPCGTKVTLSYGGHTVVATVDDRGPYVYGRSFDLNQNTARDLGMWGVATVFASI